MNTTKTILASLTLLVGITAQAQLGSSGATTYNYFSEEEDNPAWVKDIITADGENYSNLRDRQGVLAGKQQTVALEVAASNVIDIANRFDICFEDGVRELESKTDAIPTNGFTIGIVMQQIPSQGRKTIDGYIVEKQYVASNNTDVLTVYFSKRLAFQPNIHFPFIVDGNLDAPITVVGKPFDANFPGSGWNDTNDVVKVVNGDTVTYQECHKIYVKRPESLAGRDVWFNPYIRYGHEGVIDYGGVALSTTTNNVTMPLFTGVITNTVNKEYVTIIGGAIQDPGFVSYE